MTVENKHKGDPAPIKPWTAPAAAPAGRHAAPREK